MELFWWIIYAFLLIIGWKLYGKLFRSLEVVRDFSHLKINKQRAPKNIPPVYPNGWFKVLDSHKLQKGEVKHIKMLGLDLALFRGEDSKSTILDAYCPHLGANLALGGKVKGNCIQCPFHGWRFDEKGTCVEIPYAEKVPSFAKTKSWPVLEINGQILIHFDAEGREPSWIPPITQQVQNNSWNYIGRTEHIIPVHIQDIPENGSDIAHLAFLHEDFVWWSRAVKHVWKASWAPSKVEGENHMTDIRVEEYLTFNGWFKIPFSRQLVKITQIGPGIVYIEFSTAVGKLITYETVTPLEPFLQRAEHVMWAESKVPKFIAKFILDATVKQFEKDVPIWGNKTFIKKPLLIKEDGNITQFRRWYSQFYSENSPTVQSIEKRNQETNLDW